MEVLPVTKQASKYEHIDKAVRALFDQKEPKLTFEERKAAIEVAIKLELLKLKSKGGQFGRGFTEEEGAEDEID
jgi:hypothetical protein